MRSLGSNAGPEIENGAALVSSEYAYYESLRAFLVKSVDVDLARLSRKTVFRNVFHHYVFFDDLMILCMS